MSRPVLLLDVMGTLVHDPFDREFPAFFGMSLPELFAVKHPTSWFEFERGEIDEADYLARLFADGRPFDHDAFREHVFGSYRWLPGIPELLAELRDVGVTACALSNYPCWYRQIDDRLGLSRYLERWFVSCELGHRKPHPQAWLLPLSALGRAPEECLFVDDRDDNCEAARALGMPAIRFEHAGQLRADLTARGVL